ncbi:MAG: DUF268 domain-containing protein [Rubrivivax sp.]|jgi:hypothetical protein|nr:DUF268 domain-containing protein [Rubrivivax sp.]
MRSTLSRVALVLRQFGVDPRHAARALAALPRYVADWRRFASSRDAGPMVAYPCLLDRGAGASALGEYFWQDLHVARRVIEQAPRRHVDVGSRIDGFVAHLACTRRVEVFDIRPLAASIPNVGFRRWDLTGDGDDGAAPGTADCVSCLHTLEHVGLGRYGDAVDPRGWLRALSRLAALVEPGGRLWLSVPVGRPRVEFNAHRIFDPRVLRAAAEGCGLVLAEFAVFDASGALHAPGSADGWDRIATGPDALGLFRFDRPSCVDAGVA